LFQIVTTTGTLFPRAEESMNNERVTFHGSALSLNFRESDCALFYLLRSFVWSVSRGYQILQNCELLKRLNTLLHSEVILLNLSSGGALLKVQHSRGFCGCGPHDPRYDSANHDEFTSLIAEKPENPAKDTSGFRAL
jgi:hypothetical protein